MKQCYCFLERFNNYFNRKLIKYESLSDYEDRAKDSFIPYNEDGSMTSFDFNPNDNVTTEIIANDVPFDPDYFLLLDTDGKIVQRWFILEQKRNRLGQWLYQLKRDVLADNLDSLLKAPIFVEKGMLRENDPFIVNSEGMSLNEIKFNEIKLLDKSKTAWIVGYMAKNSGGADINIQVGSESIDIDYYTMSEIASSVGLTEGQLVNLLNTGDENIKKTLFSSEIRMKVWLYNDIPLAPIDNYMEYDFTFTPDFSSGNGNLKSVVAPIHDYLFRMNGRMSDAQRYKFADYFRNAVTQNSSYWNSNVNSLLDRDSYLTTDKLQILKSRYNGELVLYNGDYYRFYVDETGIGTTTKENLVNDGVNPALTRTVNTTISLASGDFTLTSNSTCVLKKLEADNKEAYLSIRLVSITDVVPQLSTKISSSRKTTGDQEYDIFAIPLNIDINNGSIFTTSENFSKSIASAIAREENAKVYDLQLLPYCPIPQLVVAGNYIDVTGLTVDEDYSLIQYYHDGNTVNCGIVFYIQNSTFTTVINETLYIPKSKKIVSNCYKWRLNSPNYQGSFDFNIAKNGGRVNYFNVFCTYKPFTPVIKIAPNFEWLYGAEYQDNRGLICGGDFSLPRVNDAWISYQLNNKNYQNIFNREIQHLDFMQGIEMRNQLVSGAVGIVSDTAKGAVAGGLVGGGYGAIAGGVIGGTASAIGYGIDVDTMARTHRENKQLAIDKFNYQLGNIKALPYTLTKVGSFDAISKIFPFIEEYCCSEKEMEAFEAKIRYEAMTVMRIGTLEEFMNFNNNDINYFKGSLIRNNEIADDTHILNAIYEELLKGVYI